MDIKQIMPKRKGTTISLRCSEDTLRELGELARYFEDLENELSTAAIIRFCVNYAHRSILLEKRDTESSQ